MFLAENTFSLGSDSGALLAPSPRGALGVADSGDAHALASPTTTPSATSRAAAPAAAAPTTMGAGSAAAEPPPPPPPRQASSASSVPLGTLARVAPSLGGSLLGACSLTAHVHLAPRRALHSSSLLHALAVGQIVCCGDGAAPPSRGAHGAMHSYTMTVPDLLDEAHVAAVSRIVDKGAAAGRTTLLVGDETLPVSAS